jgi:predicted dehydrogenase
VDDHHLTENTMTINVAVVGLGYWGPKLARNLSSIPGCRLSVLCDLRPESLQQLRQASSEVSMLTDYESVLADRNVHAVAIATPAETHFALAHSALLVGKDVFVEKPLSLTYQDGARLVRLAKERGQILMVGHVLEYHPAIVQLLQLVRRQELGKIRYIYSNRLSLGRVRREENILWSFAPHDVAVILRLMNGIPFEVSASGGSYLQANIADVTVTNFLFDNGVRAHMFVSWLHPFKEQRLVVVGAEKMASFDDVSKRLVLYDQRVETGNGPPVHVNGLGREVPFSSEEPLRLECEAFIRAVLTREPPLTDGVSGLRVLRVLEAAQRSLITNGQPVVLPVEEWERPQHPEALEVAV